MPTRPSELLPSHAPRASRILALGALDEALANLDAIAHDDEALLRSGAAVRRFVRWASTLEPILADVLDGKATKAARRIDKQLASYHAHARAIGLARESGAVKTHVIAELDARREESAERMRRNASVLREREGRTRERLDRVEVSLSSSTTEPSFGVVLAGIARVLGSRLDADLEAFAANADDLALRRADSAAARLVTLLEAVPAADDASELPAPLLVLAGTLHDARAALDVLDALEAVGAPSLARAIELAASELEQAVGRLGAARLAACEPGIEALVEPIARNLEREVDVEIEYKYLLSSFPPHAATGAARTLLQGYVPGARLLERVRKVVEGDRTHYVRTVKLGAGARRIEVEEETSAEVFEGLWQLTDGSRLEKVRYEIEDGGFTWVVDRFTDRELVLAEVEVPHVGLRPAPPAWLRPYVVREVTDDPAYVNANLAR